MRVNNVDTRAARLLHIRLSEGALARPDGAWLLRVPRRANQCACDQRVALPCLLALAAGASAPWPKGLSDMARAGRLAARWLPPARITHQISARTLHRPTPKVGAEHVSSAYSDLSGGAPGNRRPREEHSPCSPPSAPPSTPPLAATSTRTKPQHHPAGSVHSHAGLSSYFPG